MNYLTMLYRRRFSDKNIRNNIWKILCEEFFQKYIPKNSVVLDVAAGYCEFSNNIKAKRKIVVDINPDIRHHIKGDIDVIVSDALSIPQINDNEIDVVFQSNFLEHLKKEDIVKIINEIKRVLKSDGLIIFLNPNMRYCLKDYWMFFDHLTPLDDRAMVELLESMNFKIIEHKPKFLPYTIQSKLPKLVFLMKLYLKISFLQKIFGKQMLIVAKMSD